MTPEQDEGVPQSTTPRRAGRPPATDRAQILAAARAIIDREGWRRLTIRRLAAELGIGSTTLYHHVRDRDDLLLQLINDHAAQTRVPDMPTDPRDRIVAAVCAIRDTLRGWPWAAEVLTTDGFIARLDGSALWMVEAIISGAVESGCTEQQAVTIFRQLWYYTVGEILVRARSSRDDVDPAPPRPSADFFSELDPAETPHLAAIGDEWSVIAAQDDFVGGVEAFVDGLLARTRR